LIGGLSNLGLLFAGRNGLSGSIPDELFSLPLRVLDINQNDLSGTISSLVGNVTTLEKLDFDQNKLTGTLPSEIAQCTSLSTLQLSFNRLRTPVPTELGVLGKLGEYGRLALSELVRA